VKLPIREWLGNYHREWLSSDLIAGLTVSAATIPAALAYAQLAGLPAVYGLYASLIPPLLYAVLGTSRQLQVGPGSTLSILVAASLSGLLVGAEAGAAVGFAALLALISGGLLLAAGFLRLGFIADFLSAPVLTGFTAGAALIMIASQLPKIFGIEIDSDTFFGTLWELGGSLGETNGATLALGAGAIVVLGGLKRWLPGLPASLIVVVAGILIVSLLDLAETEGVAVVGSVPSGLPAPKLPELADVPELFGAAAAVALLVYVETIAVSREYANRHGYKIDPNQELIATGAANAGAGLFQGFPVDGSFSQTALNDSAGARSQLAQIVTAAAVAIVLVALTDLLADLPSAVLGAIIIVAVLSLINVTEIRRLHRLQRNHDERAVWLPARFDLAAAAITFSGTLLLGILQGILIGVGATLLALLYRTTRPHVALLGRRPTGATYVDVAREPDAETDPGLLIMRWGAELFFANASHFQEQVRELLDASEAPPRAVLLDASAITSIDITGADALAELITELEDDGLTVMVARARGPLRDGLAAIDMDRLVPAELRFRTVRAGVDYYRRELSGD
jgi:SulP family sulfate permease